MGFLQAEFGRVGADSHLTPREVIRDFVEMLDILCQNPSLKVGDLLQGELLSSPVTTRAQEGDGSAGASDEFSEFQI